MGWLVMVERLPLPLICAKGIAERRRGEFELLPTNSLLRQLAYSHRKPNRLGRTADKTLKDSAMLLRPATLDDVPALLDIHNDAVRRLAAIWTDKQETLAERQAWFTGRTGAGLPVIVAVDDAGTILGYGSYGPFRAKEGYRLTMEHSVYVTEAAQGRGVGKALMQRLITKAKASGVHVLVGAIDAENATSIALHERLGFETTGRLPQVGFKFGRWLDLVFMTLILDNAPAPAAGTAV
jgi:phosphinothricin acetyltransferase